MAKRKPADETPAEKPDEATEPEQEAAGKVNKSKAIRDAVEALGGLGSVEGDNAPIIEYVKQHAGADVTSAEVSMQKTKMRKKEGAPAAGATRTTGTPQFPSNVAEMAMMIARVDKLRRIIGKENLHKIIDELAD